MSLAANARDSLMTLVRLARAETAALTADLADIGKAMKAAETSLAKLTGEAAGEGAADGDPCPRRERSMSQRHSLFMTLDVLDQAAEETRTKLDEVIAEAKKLEAFLSHDLTPDAPDMRLCERRDGALRRPAMRLAS
jgi:hypothetical protein